MKQTPETIVLVNFGCEDIQKFARSIRDRHIYTMVMPYTVPAERVMEEKPVGLILCADAGTPERPGAREKFEALKLPILDLTSGTGTGDVDAAVAFCCQCGCHGSWTMEKFIDEAVADIRRQVGSAKVVLGLSGGVDSSVVAALIHKAIGRQLTCVFVNHGLLRKNEPELVQEIFARNFDMNLCYIDASDRFLDKLKGVADPEQKRKIIGKEFIEVFAEAAARVDAPFLGQGTIYPDILESIPLDGNPNGVIKSHHNVGGLPKNMKFKLVEPVERLFKDEVRQVGRLLGLPSELIDRHPFPGPSLGVRHVGPIERDTLHMLREADAIVTEELTRAGWYHKTWQTFAIFVPVKTVGIKNGQRSYDYVIAIRSINSVDAVTAQVVRLPWELLETMMERIVREVDGVNRVVYDITAKPPGTIEWE
ncbi:glutamine-hydrolyzing GMP synthase [bacterium]|uniref:glutamine-hydrolyzing GMP synthase n=1 Tax=uncultured Victivallis sp. TaxID=354118 RepID=UPI0025953A77|nr:glutamine-hydrolyzing GMP synthase [uncultured Victivallis sp.]MBS5531083.1 glutamine-hydrolyzing GMP synthase [bacterium]